MAKQNADPAFQSATDFASGAEISRIKGAKVTLTGWASGTYTGKRISQNALRGISTGSRPFPQVSFDVYPDRQSCFTGCFRISGLWPMSASSY